MKKEEYKNSIMAIVRDFNKATDEDLRKKIRKLLLRKALLFFVYYGGLTRDEMKEWREIFGIIKDEEQ